MIENGESFAWNQFSGYSAYNVVAKHIASRLLEVQCLLYQPGTRFNYSVSTDAGCHWRLARQCKNSTGGQATRGTRRDTAFYVSEEKAARFPNNYGPKPDGDGLRVTDAAAASRYLRPPRLYSGGGGLVSTARDYMRFCQMLLNKGELNGTRLLKATTIQQLTRNQLPESAYPISLSGRRDGVGFGLDVGGF